MPLITTVLLPEKLDAVNLARIEREVYSRSRADDTLLTLQEMVLDQFVNEGILK